jgi:uncharacterized protein YllA (UPF0747 family)
MLDGIKSKLRNQEKVANSYKEKYEDLLSEFLTLKQQTMEEDRPV